MRALKLVFLVGLLALAAVAANAQYYTLNASGSLNAEGAITSGVVYNVTASSTALVPLLDDVKTKGYRSVIVQVTGSSKTVYLNGTVATPTLGLALKDSQSPIIIPLGSTDPDIDVIGAAGGEVIRLIPVK